mmetsp:Transcript_123419/g.263176  ORF Transcript_123419/g.263176 Transcript_123419/m.263176 type:complete len:271 (+) Transcript_123419:625-1437(+)
MNFAHLQIARPFDRLEEVGDDLLGRLEVERAQHVPDILLGHRWSRDSGVPGHEVTRHSGLLFSEDAHELQELAFLQRARLVHIDLHPKLRAVMLRERVSEPVQRSRQLEGFEGATVVVLVFVEDLEKLRLFLFRPTLLTADLLQELQNLLKEEPRSVRHHVSDALHDDAIRDGVPQSQEQLFELRHVHEAIAIFVVLLEELLNFKGFRIPPPAHRQQELRLAQLRASVDVKLIDRCLGLLHTRRQPEPTHGAGEFLGRNVAGAVLVVAVE